MAEPRSVVHTRAVLALMVEQANEDGQWHGFLTNLVEEVGGKAHYSVIRKILVTSGAAEQVARGGGNRGSTWQVLNPDADLMSAAIGSGKLADATGRLERVEQLIAGIHIPTALGSLQRDINLLKEQVTKLLQEKG